MKAVLIFNTRFLKIIYIHEFLSTLIRDCFPTHTKTIKKDEALDVFFVKVKNINTLPVKAKKKR